MTKNANKKTAAAAPSSASITTAELGALDAQLAAFGARSKSTLFSFRVRHARALLGPTAKAFFEERHALLQANVKKRADGSLDIEDLGDGSVRFGFIDGKAEFGMRSLNELFGYEVELPAGLKPFTAAEIDAAGIVATEPELQALGPLLDMAAV